MIETRAIGFECEEQHFSLQAYFPEGKVRGTVFVCHAWRGQSDFERARAEALAELGYIAIAHDVFGEGVLAHTPEECMALMNPLMQDRELLGRRLLAGINAAAGLDEVDFAQMAAIGFCFGGLSVLDMARRQMPVKAVASFHGIFAPLPTPTEHISAHVLALHGYDDPMATPENLVAFGDEMTAASADWQVHAYGGTSHAFTNPLAQSTEDGMMYSSEADRRASRSALDLLSDVFPSE